MVREICPPGYRVPVRAAVTWAVVLILVLCPPLSALAQRDDPLVRRLVDARTDETRAKWEKDLGKITAEQYRSRYNAAHDRYVGAVRDMNRLSPQERDRIRRQSETLYKIQITPQVQQWEAELQAQKDGKNDQKRQAMAAMNRDIPIAAQLQVKRTRLRQQRDKGQITEQEFQAQDKAAEQQILAMANNHAATGYGTTFANLSAAAAEKILKQSSQPARTGPASGSPKDDLFPDGRRTVLVDKPPSVFKKNADFFLFFGIVGGIGLMLALMYKRRKPDGSRLPPLSDNFGSATWAQMETKPLDPKITYVGVFLGKSSEPTDHGLDGPGAPIIAFGEQHTLIVGRTRTGKGTRVIVPTLLRYYGSVLVIDPKGENAAVTARTRRDTLRNPVHILNPWGLLEQDFAGKRFAPASFNPLDTLDRNDPNAVATARKLANAICPVTGRGDDLFWQQSAATILTAVFLWLADQPGESKTLARTREIVTLSRKAFTEQFLTKMVVSTAFGGAIREMVGNLIDLADQTYTGITANLTLTTAFISDPQLKKATSASTFDIRKFRTQPTTIYLVIPPDQIEAQKTWLRLMIAAVSQAFRQPVPAADRIPCMLLIDEFPALGKLQDMPTDIATMAGYGLSYTLIVQGIDQLKAIYDKDAGAILNNCAYKWYCNITDLEGAKHLSESLGESTVRTTGKSYSSGATGAGNASSSESVNYGEKGRRLMTPDEIINIGRDVAFAFRPGRPPMWLKPIDYWDITTAFGHYASDPQMRPLYWEPPVTWDANPYIPGSTGETGRGNAGSGQSQGGPGPQPGGDSGQGSGGTGTRTGNKPPPGGDGSSSGSSKSDQSKSGQSGPKPPKQPPPMSAEEARAVLGVGPKATKDEIQAAYRRLMGKVHPDHEGTTYLAQKINEAKAVLLGK